MSHDCCCQPRGGHFSTFEDLPTLSFQYLYIIHYILYNIYYIVCYIIYNKIIYIEYNIIILLYIFQYLYIYINLKFNTSVALFPVFFLCRVLLKAEGSPPKAIRVAAGYIPASTNPGASADDGSGCLGIFVGPVGGIFTQGVSGPLRVSQ